MNLRVFTETLTTFWVEWMEEEGGGTADEFLTWAADRSESLCGNSKAGERTVGRLLADALAWPGTHEIVLDLEDAEMFGEGYWRHKLKMDAELN